MKVVKILALALLGLSMIACSDDDENTFDYQIQIMSPNEEAKHIGDNIHLHVVFTSQTEDIVHNIKLKIYNSLDNSIVAYNHEEHVHATATYEHHDDLLLDAINNVTEHTDWILEATVSGQEGEEEVIETIGFHVHP